MVTLLERSTSLVTFNMTLTGEVNGTQLSVTGSGQTREADGLLWGRYDLHALPEGMHPRILNAFVITGHNATSMNLDGATNPFRPLTHEYLRTVDFSGGHQLVLKARCRRNGDHIESQFELNGSVGDKKLVRAEPLVEIWTPGSPGHIHGHFTIVWITEDGERVFGEASTEYELAEPRLMPCSLHRFVTIQSRVDGNKFAQNQQVTLFKDFPAHSAQREEGFD